MISAFIVACIVCVAMCLIFGAYCLREAFRVRQGMDEPVYLEPPTPEDVERITGILRECHIAAMMYTLDAELDALSEE